MDLFTHFSMFVSVCNSCLCRLTTTRTGSRARSPPPTAACLPWPRSPPPAGRAGAPRPRTPTDSPRCLTNVRTNREFRRDTNRTHI
eukprot:1184772-Prorocentrum_minimum.AAC.2